eukprot:CAMPEP_0167744174 /NCGR_PEP_ID=MMETSP0110_2-20121227/2437_1 /TAXON_ID=629695 /ORGANISM="Gymnochlora sp., Strain CCMP2014" /LENGTH=584 /DNA_ID=CAMNT_0007628651 /DNA_START=315 /DNA_END=2069 /DNA_ORIENTATION=+
MERFSNTLEELHIDAEPGSVLPQHENCPLQRLHVLSCSIEYFRWIILTENPGSPTVHHVRKQKLGNVRRITTSLSSSSPSTSASRSPSPTNEVGVESSSGNSSDRFNVTDSKQTYYPVITGMTEESVNTSAEARKRRRRPPPRPRQLVLKRQEQRRERRMLAHQRYTSRPLHTLRHLRLHSDGSVASPEHWRGHACSDSSGSGDSRRGSPPQLSPLAEAAAPPPRSLGPKLKPKTTKPTPITSGSEDTASAGTSWGQGGVNGANKSAKEKKMIPKKKADIFLPPRATTTDSSGFSSDQKRETPTGWDQERKKEHGDIGDIISKMSGLQSLCLSRLNLTSSDDAKKMFSGLLNIECLELDSCGISDDGLKALAESPASRFLRYLLVGSHEPLILQGITDRGLQYLSKIKSLEALDLSNQRRITKGGISMLAKELKGLKFLNLDGTEADDKTLEDISNHCKSLHWLSIQSTNVTDKGLAILARMPSLREVGVTYCEGLTPAIVPEILRSPSLETVELLDATRTAGISREQAEKMGRVVIRQGKPDLYIFCWTIGTMAEHYLPGCLATPIFSSNTNNWVKHHNEDKK